MRGSRGIVVVIIVGALAVSLFAAGRTTTSAGAAPARTYVALGDSFAAGPGVPDATGGTCLRSTGNYPAIVAARMHLTLTDVTCSGATTANVLDTPQDGNPPQVSALSAGTDYVTLTIGNNDVGYTRASITCGMAAASAAASACLDPDAVEAAFGQLRARLVATLRAVRRAAPNATVLLVTYPRTLPRSGTPCPPQNPMRPDDTRLLTDVGARLQRDLVAAARTAKVTLVNPYPPTGHDVCTPEAVRWIEGAAPESPALIWHPNARGMAAQARLVVRAMEILDKTTGK